MFHAQRHALAVDIGDLEGDNFACAQPRGIGQRERGLMREVAGSDDQATDFLTAEYHGKGVWHAHRTYLGHQFRMIDRDVKEELQAGDGRVQRDR